MGLLRKGLLLVLLSSGCTLPGTPMSASVGRSQTNYIESSYEYLAQHEQEYGLVNPSEELAVISENEDSLGYTHIKFQQMVRGVPVWGNTLTVHFSDKNEIYRVTGKAFPGVRVVDTTPVLSTEAAGNIATTEAVDQERGWIPVDIMMYVYAGISEPMLVFEVTITKGLARMFILVDAHDGSVVKRLSGMPTQ